MAYKGEMSAATLNVEYKNLAEGDIVRVIAEGKIGSTLPELGKFVRKTSDGLEVLQGVQFVTNIESDALQEQIDEIAEKAGSGYIPKGEATVATLNALSGQENGELYTMTDAGTLTDGSLAVVAGDTVAWDATNEVWYKAMDYAPRQYGTDQVKNLPTSITSFRTGDVIPVDGPSGTAKMGTDSLLQEAADNALAKILPAFDPNKSADPDTGFAYNVGESVIYNGEIKLFIVGHTGAWNNSDAVTIQLPGVFYTAEVIQRLMGNRLDDSKFSKAGYFISGDGTLQENSDFGDSGKCPCVPGEYLSFFCEGAADVNKLYRHIAFFDKDKNFIDAFVSPQIVRRQLVPKNAYYFSIPIYWVNGVPQRTTAAGYVPSSFIPYAVCAEKVKSAVDSLYVAENIFDKTQVEPGYIDSIVNGVPHWNNNNAFRESDFIDIRKKTLFVWNSNRSDPTLWSNATFITYDEDKNPLAMGHVGNSKPEILRDFRANAAYVRVPLAVADLDVFALGYEKFNRYVPYGYKPKAVLDIDVTNELGNSPNSPISQQAVTQALSAITPSGSQWSGKKWYAYGTSITNTNSEGKYATYLAQLSGMLHTNKGISGGGIGNLGGYSSGQVFNAICNITDGKTEADLITLETGANDVNASVPLGTIYDDTQDTLAGCLNLCIRYLQTNTNAQIAIMPSVATTIEPNEADQYYKWQLMMRDICTINRVFFIEPACNLGYGKLTGLNGTLYRVDTIHQTDLGGYILAEAMWEQIKRIPNFRTTMPV
jgi:hypothetical protein